MGEEKVEPPKPGDTIADKYELLRLIGEGGMGLVFEAKHRSMARSIAATASRRGVGPGGGVG